MEKKECEGLSIESLGLVRPNSRSSRSVFTTWKNKYLRGVQSLSWQTSTPSLPPSSRRSTVKLSEGSREGSLSREQFRAPKTSEASEPSVPRPTLLDPASSLMYRKHTQHLEQGQPAWIQEFQSWASKKHPSGRREAELLRNWLDHMLDVHVYQAGKPAEPVLDECMEELVSQVSASCQQRGELLEHLWKLYKLYVPQRPAMPELKRSRKRVSSKKKIQVVVETDSSTKDALINKLTHKVKDLQALVQEQATQIQDAEQAKNRVEQHYKHLQGMFDYLVLSPEKQERPVSQIELSHQSQPRETRTVVASTSDLELLNDELETVFQFKRVKRPPRPYAEVKIRGYFDDHGLLHRSEMRVKAEVNEYKDDIVPLAALVDSASQTSVDGVFVPLQEMKYIEDRFINLEFLDDIQIIAPFAEEEQFSPGLFSIEQREDAKVELALESHSLVLLGIAQELSVEQSSSSEFPQEVLVVKQEVAVQTDATKQETMHTEAVQTEAPDPEFSQHRPVILSRSQQRGLSRAGRLLSGLVKKFVEKDIEANTMKKFLLRLVSTTYSEKAALLREGNCTQPLTSVLYRSFMHRFGLKPVAERKYKRTVNNLLQMRRSKRVENFLKFLGLLEKYDVDDLNLYLSFYDVNQGKFTFNNEESATNFYINYQRAAALAKTMLEDKLTRNEWETAKTKVDQLKVSIMQELRNQEVVDIDEFAEVVLHNYRRLKTRLLEFLARVCPDLTPDTLLSRDDCALIFSELPKRLAEEEVDSFFSHYVESSHKRFIVRAKFLLKEIFDRGLVLRAALES